MLKDILKTKKLKEKKVKFCGEDVTIRVMSGLDFSIFSEMFDNEKDNVKKAAIVLSFTLYEDDKRAFADGEIEDLLNVNFKELQRVARLASILCGLSSDSNIEEAEKNS